MPYTPLNNSSMDDSNQQTNQFSMEFSAAVRLQPPIEMHNFMPMPALDDHSQFPVPVYHHHHHFPEMEESSLSFFTNTMAKNLRLFWYQRKLEIQSICECDSFADFRSCHLLPFARIKKIMKLDEKVKMISSETPVLFSKACELFILELTARAWMHTEINRRRTLQRCDVAVAIRHDDILDFLSNLVPCQQSLHHHHHQSLGDEDESLSLSLVTQSPMPWYEDGDFQW